MNSRLALLTAFSLLLVLPTVVRADEAGPSVWIAVEGAPAKFRLERSALAGLLAGAPRELTDAAREVEVRVSLPRPDGTLARFRVEESPILSPAMTEKYGIHTYAARGLDEPAAIARFDLGPAGFHALVLAPSGSLLIRPDQPGSDLYLSVRHADDAMQGAASCLAADLGLPAPPDRLAGTNGDTRAGTLAAYRLATAATGEFTFQNGKTVANALAAITTVINEVNAIYRRDLGIRLDLVSGTDQVIYTNGTTDPYTSGSLSCTSPPGSCAMPDCLLTENQCNLDAVLGSGAYDIGIVFDRTIGGGATGLADLASVCSLRKGRGATGGTTVELTAHEIGHMFDAHHSFNDGTNGSCGSLLGTAPRDADYAVEPGSGSTIMSYAGTCGAADLQKSRDLDFGGAAVVSARLFTEGAGSACGTVTNTGNDAPVILGITPSLLTIPVRTPFLLQVDVDDNNGDSVTVSWEEADTGTASPPEGDDASRPIFRIYPPTSDAWRSFPSLNYVSGFDNVPPATVGCGGSFTCLSGESLPTTSRLMDFGVVVRDNFDGIAVDGVTLFTDAGSGPFEVVEPLEGTRWVEGALRTVTWHVANTAANPVGCTQVRILLSHDAGQTFPYVLASSTYNDGSETVRLPFGTTVRAVIKVEAIGNIFYDWSEMFVIDELQVTNTSDSGPGSLRQAISDANSYANGATIPIRIPGSGVRTIPVSWLLPAITKPVILDAWELGGPDYTGPPLLELVGSGCPETGPGLPCDGLTLLADNSLINGIVVRNFAGNGIVLRGSGAYANGIQNSYIGTDATGTTAAGNGKSGILIDGGYGQPLYGNFIGLNVISGNQVGVTINGATANGNAVVRNKIGLNAAGSARIPNLDDGVRILGAPNTVVGQPGSGNVISGNGTVLNGFVNRYADAIEVNGATASGTVIQGNIIGLDATGTTGIYNTAGEINVTGAPNTLIGGAVSGARNMIGDDGTVNLNNANCVYVAGAGATGTVIQGNFLGTDATGTLDRGCRGAGVFIEGASGVQIGGTTAATRNVISGNNNYAGVWVTGNATGTMIQGNYIGTDVTGTAAIPNASYGVQLLTGGNTIGGTAAGAGNVISGNTQRGIDIYQASNNVIQGNFIGTNAAGTAALGNGTYGINLTYSPNNQIGGAQPGARNVISGNVDRGIFISGAEGMMAPGNIVQGNYIGTDVTGSAGIGNTTGIELYYVRDATVAGNVISAGRAGNAGVRINSFGVATSGIVIQGNKIGTNAAGTAPLGNTGEGIWASIAGTASILGNVVAASGNNGINIVQGSFTIQGNWIGTDVTGTLDLRNTWSGIWTGSTSACLIGGTGPGEGNVIAFNAPGNTGTNHAGVVIGGAAASQTVRGNRIYSNTGLGIDLLPFTGVSGPDVCDPDTGPNGSQNFPVLTAANQSGSSTHVTGTLSSNASTTFTIDFYSSPSCDSLGYGEGSSYLGSATVPTDGSCNGSFDLLLPVPSAGALTATATSPAGNTSEFSACRTVAPSPVAEVLGVVWASKSELTWAAAAGATSYRVLRGDSQTLPDLLDVDLDSCARFTGAALTTGPGLTEDPASAGIRYYWYLVVGSDGTNDGPAGSATAMLRVANPSGACP